MLTEQHHYFRCLPTCNYVTSTVSPRFGSGVVNLNLQHREAVFQLNSSLLCAFLRLEFSLDATVDFESVSGILQGRIPVRSYCPEGANWLITPWQAWNLLDSGSRVSPAVLRRRYLPLSKLELVVGSISF